jgi:hypothetical protein
MSVRAARPALVVSAEYSMLAMSQIHGRPPLETSEFMPAVKSSRSTWRDMIVPVAFTSWPCFNHHLQRW